MLNKIVSGRTYKTNSNLFFRVYNREMFAVFGIQKMQEVYNQNDSFKNMELILSRYKDNPFFGFNIKEGIWDFEIYDGFGKTYHSESGWFDLITE